MTEFDRGYRECEEHVVAPMYAAIEDTIESLKIGMPIPEIIAYLKKTLKECDAK